MNKVINITSNGIKQAIDDLVNENEMLQDKVYKLENILNELEKYLNKVIQTSTEQEKITCSFVLQYLQELKGSDKE